MASSLEQKFNPSSSSSSSSCDQPSCNYDVFLSFQGEDTRKKFVSHLYAALDIKTINTFIDNQRIEIGDNISEELHNAIKGSRYAVVVLSQNYTTSRWCLSELRLIMELYKLGRIKVLPIFYEVIPSQRESFSLKEYAGQTTEDTILGWEEALELVAGLSGAVSKDFSDEYNMLETIVERISRELPSTQPTSFDNVFCMEAHIEHMEGLLKIESEGEARIVGIWGMGGIGKTTIAKYLYERFSPQYFFHSFIDDVHEVYEKAKLIGLQTQLLCDIFSSKRVALRNERHGAELIQSRLKKQKVFIVLDGVDKMEQIDGLASEARWFGKGSRIIITTRDKRLLDSSKVVDIYKVECLKSEDSLKMFEHFAFKGEYPPFESYNEELGKKASQLGHGLPLALYSLGLHFRGAKTEAQWKAEIDTIENSSARKITDTLKCSYNNLDRLPKLAFLTIACLLTGHLVSRVSDFLYGYGSRIVEVLTDMSLIHISSDGVIEMHSLVQQMGREVVREESDYKPRNQAFLWDHRNVHKILKGNNGTKKIKGMVLHICDLEPGSSIGGNPFNKMHNLIYLKFFKHLDVIATNLDHLYSENCILLSPGVRLLHWDAYPFTSLPPNISLHCLVELRLRYSNLKSLWDGKMSIPELKILDVTGSKNLIKFPDLSSALQLEELITKGCSELTQFLGTTYKLTTLKKLDVSDCDNLMKLDMVLKDFPLQPSSTEDFKTVAKVFPDAVATTESLTNLSLQCQITFRLKHLRGKAAHLSFSSEKHIRCALIKADDKYDLFTDFYGFKSLDIKNFNYKKTGRSFEFKSFSDFICLTELNLINLNMHLIEVDIGLLQELQKLDLSGNDFPDLPKQMENLSMLKSLRLTNCCVLRDLPELTPLKTLALSDCINLLSFPHKRKYHFLQNLWLDNCSKVQNLSDTLSKCLNLTYLDLSRNNFGTLPASIKLLSLLGTLCLNYCNNLESLTDLPLSLKYVHAQGCNSLEHVDLPFDHCIRHLDLSYCPKLNDVEHLTNQFIKCGRNEEVSQRFVCLPGGIVPSCFDCKATSLPHIWHTVESVGFSACIMIACESPYHLQLCSSSYSCKKEGNGSYILKLKPEFSIPSESTTEGEKFIEQHMFIFHIEENVDELHLKSHLELSKEFQFTLEESISYRVRVVHKTREEDPEHDLSCGDLPPNGKLEADSVDYFKKGKNEEVQPRNDCLEDTEMPSYILGNQQTSETRSDSLEHLKDITNEEEAAQPQHPCVRKLRCQVTYAITKQKRIAYPNLCVSHVVKKPSKQEYASVLFNLLSPASNRTSWLKSKRSQS